MGPNTLTSSFYGKHDGAKCRGLTLEIVPSASYSDHPCSLTRNLVGTSSPLQYDCRWHANATFFLFLQCYYAASNLHTFLRARIRSLTTICLFTLLLPAQYWPMSKRFMFQRISVPLYSSSARLPDPGMLYREQYVRHGDCATAEEPHIASWQFWTAGLSLRCLLVALLICAL